MERFREASEGSETTAQNWVRPLARPVTDFHNGNIQGIKLKFGNTKP